MTKNSEHQYEVIVPEDASRDYGVRVVAESLAAAFSNGSITEDDYVGNTVRTNSAPVPSAGISGFTEMVLSKAETSIVSGIPNNAQPADFRNLELGFIGDVHVVKDSNLLHVSNLGILATGIISYQNRDSEFIARHAVFPMGDFGFYARYSSQIWGIAIALDTLEQPNSRARIDWSSGQARIGWTQRS